MFDLSDLTFIVSYKKDTEDRERNLKIILKYFSKFFTNYNVIILESDKDQKGKWTENLPNVKYVHVDLDCFHKSYVYNKGASLSTTKYLSFWDVDVICDPGAVNAALIELKKGLNMGFCYNGVFLELKKEFIDFFVNSFSFHAIPKLESSASLIGRRLGAYEEFNYIHYNSPGACIFFNKEVFLKYAGYNIRFKKWGFEDDEILHRFLKLGESCFRIGNVPIVHLEHNRNVDGTPQNEFYASNLQEFQKVKSMNKEDLLTYVNSELKSGCI